MFKLGIKKYADSVQMYDASLVHGTVEECIENFVKESGVKNAEVRPKDKVNLNKLGSQLMFIIREINKDKKEDDLLTSDDLFLSKEMSDEIRSGELHLSALKKFVVVQHTNNETSKNPGAVYPLIVRPQQVTNSKELDKFAIKRDTAVTKEYTREETDSVMGNLVL